MNKKRKISVVITARPSYSRIKTVLSAIKNHPKLELNLIVAASALLNRYGSSINYIKEDGFDISEIIYNVIEGDSLVAAPKTTGLGIIEISSVFNRLNPDIVITVADRFETIATAIAASYMNIPLAHVQGGEVTGNIDEKVRHAITKLSDYHFASTLNAKERIIKLGEDQDYVFNTGCPSIDIAYQVQNNHKLEFNLYEKYGGVGSAFKIASDYIVVMQHPVTNEFDKSRIQIEATLEAIKKINMPTFWFWPNVDSGSDGTSNGIRNFREKNDISNIHFFKGMEPTDFLSLLVNSKCLIGNSSVGIRECSFLGVPVVNIGSRQKNRERGYNVIDVDYSSDKIIKSINISINKVKVKKSNIYGDGSSGFRIAEILAKVPLKFHKTIMY